MAFDETHAYAPSARRFMETGRIVAEVDNYEARHLSAGVPFVPPILLGALGWSLGSIEKAFVAADVLFPPLMLVLLYVATEGIVQGVVPRLLVAWTTLIVPFGPRNFLWAGYDALLAAPDFTRTPQPEISLPILLVAALLLSSGLSSPRPIRNAILVGFVSALVVYCYYFYAVAWVLTLGLLIIAMLAWKEARRVWYLLIVGSVMLAASTPFVLATLRGRQQGGQQYLLARMGAASHSPAWIWLAAFAIGLILYLTFGQRLLRGIRRPQQIRLVVMIALLLSGVAGLNFHVISGYNAQHAHFWNRLILPVAWLLLASASVAAIYRLTPDSRRALNRLSLLALSVVLLNVATRQVVVGLNMADHHRSSSAEVDLLRWVGRHVPAGSVIGTAEADLILLLPAFGPYYSYVPSGIRSLTATEDIVDRYYAIASMLRCSPAEMRAKVHTKAHMQPSQLFLALGYGGPEKAFLEAYNDFLRAPRSLNHRLDYLVQPLQSAVVATPALTYPHATILYENTGYRIIKLL